MIPTPAEIQYYTMNLLDRCSSCYKTLDNAKSIIVDRVDYTVCEEETLCGHCNAKVDYWAYGNSERDGERVQFEKNYPKAAELIQRLTGKWQEIK